MGTMGISTNNLEVKSKSSLEEMRFPEYPKEGFGEPLGNPLARKK